MTNTTETTISPTIVQGQPCNGMVCVSSYPPLSENPTVGRTKAGTTTGFCHLAKSRHDGEECQ
jgi:hypothetical protein